MTRAREFGGGEFVRFPPRWRNVLVPTTPPGAATLGMTLYTASKPIPLAAQYALWAAAKASGGRFLPGPRETWSAPLPEAVFDELCAAWTESIGRVPDGIALYERLDPTRQNLTLLVCAGEHSMLVRVRHDGDSLAQERALSEAANDVTARVFRVPRLVGSGVAAGWHWVGYEVMSQRPHRPRYRLDGAAFDQISSLVESVQPRPQDVPAHWRGAHGDLTPWNLRRGRGSTWLIDWEDACWAPPFTDLVYLRAIVAAIRPGRVRPFVHNADLEEARAYWARALESRTATTPEQRLLDRLQTLLRSNL